MKLETANIERYQDLVDYFDDESIAKTILGNREEFKKWLERIKWHVHKADELARKLEQEPCEDCVSRQAVLDLATVIETDDFSGNEIMEVVKTDDIKALPSVLPSVTPAPKKCHNVNTDYAECDQFVCSRCGIELQDWHQVERDEDDGDITYRQYEFHFCPNCGAKIEVKYDAKEYEPEGSEDDDRYVFNRYLILFGPNTRQWWVYDEQNNCYIDPPISVLQEIQSNDFDSEAMKLRRVVSDNPEWLKDVDHVYSDIEI